MATMTFILIDADTDVQALLRPLLDVLATQAPHAAEVLAGRLFTSGPANKWEEDAAERQRIIVPRRWQIECGACGWTVEQGQPHVERCPKCGSYSLVQISVSVPREGSARGRNLRATLNSKSEDAA